MSGPLYSYKENFEEIRKSRYRLFVSELGNHAVLKMIRGYAIKESEAGQNQKIIIIFTLPVCRRLIKKPLNTMQY